LIRLCILGDSHVGALLEADVFRALKRTHKVTFFTAHIDNFPDLYLRDGKLCTDNEDFAELLQSHSGGKREIVLEDYDEFVLMGLGLSAGAVAIYYYDYIFDGIYDKLDAARDQKYVVSDAFFSKLCQYVLLQSEAMRIATTIRKGSSRPITVVAAPNPGLGMAESEYPEWFPPFHAIMRDGLDAIYARIFREVCALLAEKHGVMIIPSLPEAAENGVFNRFEYSLFSELAEGAPDDEKLNAIVHGNGRYGKLLIKRILNGSPAAD
jgi:hypothetical protein